MPQIEAHAIRIQEEKDIEILRQIALVQDREIRVLVERIQKLTQQLARLQGHEAARVQQELDLLQDILARCERAANEHSTESHPRSAVERSEPGERAPRRGHGPRPQPELPIEEKRYELPEGERDCPECGGTLVPMGDQCEESEEITVVQRRFVLVKQQRQKYRCRCNGSVVTAPGPVKLQEGARYSAEFAVEVAAGKYLDHLPLERQVRIMRREGLEIDSQTLWDQLNVLARPLEPSYEALGQRVLASPVVHGDETGWRMLSKNPERWVVWGGVEPRGGVLPDLRQSLLGDRARPPGRFPGGAGGGCDADLSSGGASGIGDSHRELLGACAAEVPRHRGELPAGV
jgi:transposase